MCFLQLKALIMILSLIHISIKLYDRDAYAIEFEADIISCEPNKADDKQFDIILNQTLFFPEAVSYTHLDVYKRQIENSRGIFG